MPWGRNYGHPARDCDKCGGSFYPKQGFESLCFPCWKRDARDTRITELQMMNSFLHEEAHELRAEIRRLKEENQRLKSEGAWSEFLRQLPRLLQLCHLDRHENSTASNEATKWLLAARVTR
jgi:hypothetical protein